MIKTILVLADETPAFELTLASAVELGRRLAAHLDVLHVRSDPISLLPLAGEGLSATLIEEIRVAAEKAIDDRESRARAIYDRHRVQTDVSMAWRVATGWKPDIAAVAGRVNDLVLIGRPDGPEDALWRKTLESVLFDGGRPVLLLPPEPFPLFGECMTVAWNGSAQAAHAMTAALPLVRLAERTEVLTAGAIDTYASTPDFIAYLGHHNIKAVARVFEPSYVSVGKALLEQSYLVRSTLLVMGAYGHSKLREIVLGGATREVLFAARLPVLLAH